MQIGKKAFLLGEYTLKIIIAVLSISLLLYLLFVIYGSYNDDKKIAQAEADINKIIEKIGLAKTEGVQNLILLEPKGWILINFNKGENRPLSCEGNCICICEEAVSKSAQPEKCSEIGFCKNIKENVELQKKVYSIRKDPVLLFRWSDSEFEVVTEIKIEYKENKFIISKNE